MREIYVRIVYAPDRSVENEFVSQVNEYLWDLDVKLVKVDKDLYQVFDSTLAPQPESYTGKRYTLICRALGEALADLQDELVVRAVVLSIEPKDNWVLEHTGRDNPLNYKPV